MNRIQLRKLKHEDVEVQDCHDVLRRLSYGWPEKVKPWSVRQRVTYIRRVRKSVIKHLEDGCDDLEELTARAWNEAQADKDCQSFIGLILLTIAMELTKEIVKLLWERWHPKKES